jgi:WD40 repeat protein
VSGSFDRTAKVWRTDTGALERTLTGHGQAVVGVAVSPMGDVLATSGDDSTVRVWRLADGGLVHVLTGGSDHVYSVAFSPDGLWLASGGREKGALGTLWKQVAGGRLRGARSPTVRLWRVRDGWLQQALAEHGDDVWSVALSPDGTRLATASDDRTVKVWRLEAREARP